MHTFKVIEEYPNFSISSCGKIKRNSSGKILKTHRHKNGYEVINIKPNGRGSGKTLKIHRVVATAFIPNPLNKPQVNHKDGNKTNNNVSNLEWATPSENVKHAYDNGLIAAYPHPTKFTLDEAKIIASLYRARCHVNGARALARKFNTSHSVIINTINRVI